MKTCKNCGYFNRVNKLFGKCNNRKVKNFEVMANMAACKHFDFDDCKSSTNNIKKED